MAKMSAIYGYEIETKELRVGKNRNTKCTTYKLTISTWANTRITTEMNIARAFAEAVFDERV